MNSCEDALKGDPNINIDTTVISGEMMPITRGNSWTYYVNYYCCSTNKHDLIINWTNVNWTVTNDTIINGKKWYGIPEVGLFRNDADGVYYGTFHSDTFYTGLFFKYPCNIGDVYCGSIDGENVTYCLRGMDYISVKAGKFFCYQYGRTYTSEYENKTYIYDETYYISPHNGYIMYENYRYVEGSSSPELIKKEELISFHLN
jgi:hypothetical protein